MSTFSSEWAPDLYLELRDRHGGRSVQASVQAAIKHAIGSGRLAGGAKLPPSRVLAEELKCARAAVVGAYAQLAAEGYVETRQGSGTRVAPSATPPEGTHSLELADPLPKISFSAGVSDLSSFPRAEWQRAVGYVMGTVSPAELYYTAPVGTPRFRIVLAQRLARVRGVVADPRRVHACGGTVQAVSLLAKVFASRGVRTVAVEDPSWPRLRPPLEGAGLNIRPIRVDSHGLVVTELARHPDVGAVFVSPAHQFPTGVLMSESRRAELIDWARSSHGFIVEDDYDAEFNLGRVHIGALQSHDPQHVVYLGTSSKILSPALRLGWIVAPAAIESTLAAQRPGFDLGVSVLEQLALAHLMSTGKLDRHLRRTRQTYDRRRRLLIGALSAALPQITITGAPTGLHLIATLPAGVDENDVVAEASRRSVGVFGLGYYQIRRNQRRPGALVLGYANLKDGAIATGVELLAECIHTVRRRSVAHDRRQSGCRTSPESTHRSSGAAM